MDLFCSAFKSACNGPVPVLLPLSETDKTALLPGPVLFAHPVGATYLHNSQYYAYALLIMKSPYDIWVRSGYWSCTGGLKYINITVDCRRCINCYRSTKMTSNWHMIWYMILLTWLRKIIDKRGYYPTSYDGWSNQIYQRCMSNGITRYRIKSMSKILIRLTNDNKYLCCPATNISSSGHLIRIKYHTTIYVSVWIIWNDLMIM